MPTYYPGARLKLDGTSYGSYTSGPYKIVIHTTETPGLPGYRNGELTPHCTYNPKDRTFVQHQSFDVAVGALRNEAGGVQTNKDSALQLEVICYSAKNIADQQPYRMWVGDLPDTAYEDIAAWCRWVCNKYGVQPSVRMPRPKALYGSDSPSRMSFSQWDNYNGICGHFEVPENNHYDPGAMDMVRLVNLIKEEDMPLTQADADLVVATLKKSVVFNTNGVSVDTALGRIYNNVNELTIAHRTDSLGTDDGLDQAAIDAIVEAIIEAGVGEVVADVLHQRLES